MVLWKDDNLKNEMGGISMFPINITIYLTNQSVCLNFVLTAILESEGKVLELLKHKKGKKKHFSQL